MQIKSVKELQSGTKGVHGAVVVTAGCEQIATKAPGAGAPERACTVPSTRTFCAKLSAEMARKAKRYMFFMDGFAFSTLGERVTYESARECLELLA